MKAYCLAAAMAAGLLLSAPAYADDGNIFFVKPGCGYFGVDSPKGKTVLQWYSGHKPARDDRVSGDFNQYGFHDLTVGGGGGQMRVWAEDYLLSNDHAAKILARKCK